MAEYKLTFLGAGKMATAFAGALAGLVPCSRIAAYDISSDALKKFRETTGLSTFDTLDEAINFADVLIIAVKPQNFNDLFNEIAERASDKLIISIMAGIKISALEKKSGSKRVIRVMPNTPSLVGKGVSAYSVSDACSKRDIEIAKEILDSAGFSVQVEEKMMDAITAVSGSGPAYVFEFIESMARGGETAGLSYELALKLAIETVEGSAILLKKSGLSPEELKNNVKSPGGTTAKALEVLEENKFRQIIISAIIAAKDRAIELGKDK